MGHMMPERPDDRRINEYAIELLPDQTSKQKLLNMFGINSDPSTRLGWEREFNVTHLRSGLVDAWPNYLHASRMFITPPEEIKTASDLKGLMRNRELQKLIRDVLPDA